MAAIFIEFDYNFCVLQRAAGNETVYRYKKQHLQRSGSCKNLFGRVRARVRARSGTFGRVRARSGVF